MKTTLKLVRAPMAKRWWTESGRVEVENNMFLLERIAILYAVVAALLPEPANEWVLPLIPAAATTAALHFHRLWCFALTLGSFEPELPYWIRRLLFWVERLCFLLSFLMCPRPISVFFALSSHPPSSLSLASSTSPATSTADLISLAPFQR